MTENGRTPRLRQYAHFKGKFPDTVLLFLAGDFYEAYEGDAQILHDAAGLTLTTRADRPPHKLAGVPKEHVNGYLVRLLEAGYRVALCEPAKPADVPAGEKVIREVTEDRILGGLRRMKKGGIGWQ
ncbi:MAG: hypothetical protein JXB13_18715 [Phycisphaerae bacterium]|nr:hypothetical protein [Phycisphaerae bacterium]